MVYARDASLSRPRRSRGLFSGALADPYMPSVPPYPASSPKKRISQFHRHDGSDLVTRAHSFHSGKNETCELHAGDRQYRRSRQKVGMESGPAWELGSKTRREGVCGRREKWIFV